jgi:hypothetical protein
MPQPITGKGTGTSSLCSIKEGKYLKKLHFFLTKKNDAK